MKKLLCSICLFFSVTLAGQQWEPTYGPTGNTAWDIRTINGTVFASTNWGNYSSTDGGETWSRFDLSTANGGPQASFYPLGNDIYFCNYVSHDNGLNWSQISANSDIAKYASCNGSLYAISTYTTTYVSQNNGSTWSALGALPNGIRAGVAVLSSAVYVAVDQQGVYYTTPGSTGWHPYSSGLPSAPYISSLESDGNNLYLATCDSIYFRAGGSNAWSALASAPLHTQITRLHIFQSEIFIATSNGIYHSQPGSFNWQKITDDQGGYVYALDYDGNTLLAGFKDNGIYRTNDLGQTWSLSHIGMYAGFGAGLMCASQGKVWAANGYYHRMFSTSTQGQHWTNVPFNYQLWWPVDMMRCIYANGTDFYYGEDNGYIYYSHDGCATTVVADSSMGNSSGGYAQKFASVNNDVYVIYNGRLKRSSDRGVTWQNITGLPLSSSILDICSYNGAIYAIVPGSTGQDQIVYRSADGSNWTQVLIVQGWCGIMTASSSALYVYGEDGIHESSDDGSTWNMISTSALPATQIISSYADESGLYLVPLGHGDHGGEIFYGVYRYYNGSWQTFNTGLNSLHVSCIASDGVYLYAGVEEDGVYRVALNALSIQSRSADQIDLTVYPNPNSGAFSIETFEKGCELKVYDDAGRCVFYKSLDDKKAQINLGTKARGIYIVEVRNKNAIRSKKIVIE